MKKIAFLSMDSLEDFFVYDDLLIEPFANNGYDIETVSWRNSSWDCSDYESVIVRSPWDYQQAPEAFMACLVKATATLSGELFYQAQLGQLQIKEPTLDELEWAEHGNLVPESLLNSLKRMEGKRFPVILLLDFEQLDLSAWGIRQPKRVEITPNGLLIEI